MVLLDKILLSIFLGAFIGLEREHHKEKPGSGVRTSAFICLFGMLTTFFASLYSSPLILILGIAISGAFSLSLFWYKVGIQKHAGLTTSVAMILTYFIGAMIAVDFFREAIALAVIIFLLLFSKKRLVGKIEHLTEAEIFNAVEFAIIAFVIYPFLPDYVFLNVSIREVWGVVLVVSVISFIGFLAMRYLDERKGLLLSSLFGSIFSSSAVVVSGIRNYKRNKKLLNLFVLSSVLAFVTLAIRNMLVVSMLTNFETFMLFAKLMAVSVIFYLAAFYVLRRFPKKKFVHEFESPFAIKPALYFGLIFFIILAFSRAAIDYFGPEAVIPISILGGVGSGYAVAASLALLFSHGTISGYILTISIVLASIAGMLADTATIYAFRQAKLAGKVLLFSIIFSILLILAVFL